MATNIEVILGQEPEAVVSFAGPQGPIGPVGPQGPSGIINTGELDARYVGVTGNQNISGDKNFYLRPTVNGTGILLSGEATKLPDTIVYTTGNQNISGNKTFVNNIEVQGTGIFNAVNLSNISEFQFSGTDINLINTNVYSSGGGNIFVSGNPVLTGLNFNSNNIVFTTGNQTISGIKTFVNNLISSGTGQFNSLNLNQVDNLLISGVRLNLVNSNIVLTNPTGVPSTITSSGTKGTIVWENEYLYICVNTNSWKRIQLSNW